MTRTRDLKKRYCIAEDDCGHCYLIPAAKIFEFSKWLEDEENDGNAPEYAQRIDDGGRSLTFLDPRPE